MYYNFSLCIIIFYYNLLLCITFYISSEASLLEWIRLFTAYWSFYGYNHNCDCCSGERNAWWEFLVVKVILSFITILFPAAVKLSKIMQTLQWESLRAACLKKLCIANQFWTQISYARIFTKVGSLNVILELSVSKIQCSYPPYFSILFDFFSVNIL